MAIVTFPYRVKYKGIYYNPGTPVEVGDEVAPTENIVETEVDKAAEKPPVKKKTTRKKK